MRPEQLLGVLQIAFLPGLMGQVHVRGVEITPHDRLLPAYPAQLPGDARETNEDGQNQRHPQARDDRIAPAPAPRAFGARDGTRMDRFVAEETAEFVGQLLRGLVAARRFLFQALEADRFQVARARSD